jgi:hypothetical protein
MRSIWMRPPDFVGQPSPPPDVEVDAWVAVLPIVERWSMA